MSYASLRLRSVGLLLTVALSSAGCATRHRYLPETLPPPPESGDFSAAMSRPVPLPPPAGEGLLARMRRPAPLPAPPDGLPASTRSAQVTCDGPPESTLPPQSPHAVPRELTKVSHPDYVIEPPDILLINAPRVVPLPPYKLEPLDTVVISARAPLPNDPLAGEFVIERTAASTSGRSTARRRSPG